MSKCDIRELLRQLDEARYVHFEEDADIVFAWYGGLTVHVYNMMGEEFDMWTHNDIPTIAQINEAIWSFFNE